MPVRGLACAKMPRAAYALDAQNARWMQPLAPRPITRVIKGYPSRRGLAFPIVRHFEKRGCGRLQGCKKSFQSCGLLEEFNLPGMSTLEQISQTPGGTHKDNPATPGCNAAASPQRNPRARTRESGLTLSRLITEGGDPGKRSSPPTISLYTRLV